MRQVQCSYKQFFISYIYYSLLIPSNTFLSYLISNYILLYNVRAYLIIYKGSLGGKSKEQEEGINEQNSISNVKKVSENSLPPFH